MKYRDDDLSNSMPTISTLSIDAIDRNVARTDYYVLDIFHCRKWNPATGEVRGFVPIVEHCIRGISTRKGKFHPGDDGSAYDAAVVEGKDILANKQKEADEEV